MTDLGRVIGLFTTRNEARVVAAFLELAPEDGIVSCEDLRCEITRAEGRERPVSRKVVERGLKSALASGSLERVEARDDRGRRRFAYRCGAELARALGRAEG